MTERITSSDGSLDAMVIRRAADAYAHDACDDAVTHFYTDPKDQLQVGLLCRNKGDVVQPHCHRPQPRTVTETAEVLVFLRGRAWVRFYARDPVGVHTVSEVSGGDVVVLLKGGHSLEYLEDTELLEIKQGGYQDDKVLL